MTARDWPKGPGRDSLVQRRKEESGVSLEQARAPVKESLGLELDQGQEQEPEPEQGQEQEQEIGGKQQEQGQGQQPQGAGEGLDMASELEWLVLKVWVLLDRSL